MKSKSHIKHAKQWILVTPAFMEISVVNSILMPTIKRHHPQLRTPSATKKLPTTDLIPKQLERKKHDPKSSQGGEKETITGRKYANLHPIN